MKNGMVWAVIALSVTMLFAGCGAKTETQAGTEGAAQDTAQNALQSVVEAIAPGKADQGQTLEQAIAKRIAASKAVDALEAEKPDLTRAPEILCEEAKQLYDAGRYDAALVRLQPAADAGYAPALVLLGRCYSYGSGVDRDVDEALLLYKLAAETGDPAGQAALGDHYYECAYISEDGKDWEVDEELLSKAIEQYQLAAGQGNPEAQISLGGCYEYGEGVTQDYAEAERLYKLAGEKDEEQSLLALSSLYATREDGKQDKALALDDMERAAKLGASGKMYLADEYAGGKFAYGGIVEQDLNKAIELYAQAAEEGNASAQRTLVDLYAEGNEVPQDYQKALYYMLLREGVAVAPAATATDFPAANKEAVQLYRAGRFGDAYMLTAQGAVSGDLESQAIFADCMQYYNRGWTFSNREEMQVALYQQAAEQGNARAENSLGEYYNSQSYRKDEEAWKSTDAPEMMRLFQLAADAGDAKAMANLAYQYRWGGYVEKDESKADELYLKAAAQGTPEGLYECGTHLISYGGDNKEKGLEMVTQAAEQNLADAQMYLGNFYFNRWPNFADTQDFQKSAQWYVRLYELTQGNSWRYNVKPFLDEMYYFGYGVEQDYAKAAEMMANGETNTDFVRLGRMYETGQGVQQDANKAKALYEKSFKQICETEYGYNDERYTLETAPLESLWEGTCYALVLLHGNELIDAADPQEAQKYYDELERRAKRGGNGGAKYYMGLLNFFGGYVKRDTKKATKWMEEGAESWPYAVGFLQSQMYRDAQ